MLRTLIKKLAHMNTIIYYLEGFPFLRWTDDRMGFLQFVECRGEFGVEEVIMHMRLEPRSTTRH